MKGNKTSGKMRDESHVCYDFCLLNMTHLINLGTQTLLLQVCNHYQYLFYFVFAPPPRQPLPRHPNFTLLAALGFPQWPKKTSESQLCGATSSPSLSSQLAWVCVVWLVRPLVVSLWPKEYAVRRGRERGSQTVLWGWCASTRKQDLVGKAVDVQQEPRPRVPLSCKTGPAPILLMAISVPPKDGLTGPGAVSLHLGCAQFA